MKHAEIDVTCKPPDRTANGNVGTIGKLASDDTEIGQGQAEGVRQVFLERVHGGRDQESSVASAGLSKSKNLGW
jgi:hypothetical protein